MPFTLQPLSYAQLQDLAQARTPPELKHRYAGDALPPDFVAARAVRLIDDGQSLDWCSTFVIVRNQDNLIVGACGFKSEPQLGRVEIGYAVSHNCRRQGVASAAISALLGLGFAMGATEVLAEILPSNTASIATVKKLGFSYLGTRLDDEDELVMQWLFAKASMLPSKP